MNQAKRATNRGKVQWVHRSLIAALGFSLVCSTNGAVAAASTTLQVTTVGTAPGLSQVIAQYEKLNPDIHLTVTSIPSNTYQPTVRTELEGGHGPDIMFVWGGGGNAMSIGQLAQAGYISPLNGARWISELPANARKLFSVNGKVYAATLDYNAGAFFYNQQAFAKANVHPPKTFAQLLGDCAALNKVGIIPMDLGNEVAYLNFQIPVIFADDIAYSKDPSFGAQLSSGKTTLLKSALWHQAVLQGNTEYAQLFSNHCVEPDSTATTDTEAIAAVASGKAAMTTLLSGFQQLSQDNPKGHFGSFEAPALNTPGKVLLTVDPGLSFSINSHSSKKAQADQFLAYLAKPSVIAYLAGQADSVPNVAPKGYSLPMVLKGLGSLFTSGKLAEYPTNYFPNYQTKLSWEAEAEDIATGIATAKVATEQVFRAMR